jgi:hypothetical protein
MDPCQLDRIARARLKPRAERRRGGKQHHHAGQDGEEGFVQA